MAAIVINKTVLIWAREEAQLTQQQAADASHVPLNDLVEFERSNQALTLGAIRSLAKAYGVSVATLVMPEPLARSKRPADFRTIDGRPESISHKTALAIRKARHYQEMISDVTSEDDDLRVPYSIPDAATNITAAQLAARERKRFAVSIEKQIQLRAGQAFNFWRDSIEALGIFVYVLDFPRRDCRGFTLRESANPVIAISKEESTEGAKIFTLFHEYCHILRNQPGLSDLNNKNSVERFCNNFSAHFLMPLDALKDVLSIPDSATVIDWSADAIRQAANQLHVSQQALALRLEEAGYARQGYYEAFCAKQLKIPKRPKRDGAPPPETLRLFELGALHSGLTLNAYDRGSLNDIEARRALGLPLRRIEGLRIKLRGRLVHHGPSRVIS